MGSVRTCRETTSVHNLYKCIYIQQCEIKIGHAMSVQVDGEPWTQRPCTVIIERCEKQVSPSHCKS